MVNLNLSVSEEEEQEEPEKLRRIGTTQGGEDIEVEKLSYAPGKAAVKTSTTEKIPTKLKPNLEIPRKVLHASIGFFTLYLYLSQGDVRTILLVLWMALAVIVPTEFLRFKSPTFERLYEQILGFLMRESEKNSINGVVWYILGINFALSFYPQDVATVAILILSWADTAASTIGRLFGSYTPKLPSRVPFLRLPLAPHKSLAGFLAATVTGASIAFGFWGSIAGMRNGGRDVVWSWDEGVRGFAHTGAMAAGGPVGLSVISAVAGVVSGVAEALDLGSIDDNLSLPIISGFCILGFMKVLGLAATVSSWFS
jgi:diacylglycerol kinase (CTP)